MDVFQNLKGIFTGFFPDKCEKNNIKIEPEIPMFDIPEVMEGPSPILEFGFGRAAPAVDLCPAGDPGFDGVAHHIGTHFSLQGLIEVETVWSGAHNGHIVGKDIEELGQLVEAVFSEKLAQAGDAIVALNGG